MDELKGYELQLLQQSAPWATKQAMERLRLIVYNNTSLHAKPGTYKKNVRDFLPLYTDKDYDNVQKLSKNNLDMAREMIISAFRNKNNTNNKK